MIPKSIESRLLLPVMAAPMFLVSGTKLVIEACRNGIIGTFPSLNARTPEVLDQWLSEIGRALAKTTQGSSRPPAPYGVNLIVHRTNKQMPEHLKILVRHKVPVVITSLGAVREVIDAVHSYKGVVLHDVTNVYHAERAVAAGVDGLIAVCAGAGGHSGLASPMALLPALRRRFPKILLVAAGSIGDGQSVRAAQCLGADLAYMGTRFIATQESLGPDEYKSMLVDAKNVGPDTAPHYLPVTYTDRVSGVHANFLRASLKKAGLDPDALAKMQPVKEDFSKLDGEQAAWSKVWSAGHGCINIDDIPSVATLVGRLRAEYNKALYRESTVLEQWAQKARM